MAEMVNVQKRKGGGGMETSENLTMPFPPISPYFSPCSTIFLCGQAGDNGN